MGDKTQQKQIIESDIYESFFNHSLELFCLADPNGYFTRVNAKWTDLLGHSQKEMTSTPFIDFVHPEDKESTIAEFGKILNKNETVSFINRYRTKRKGYKWLEWSAHYLSKKKVVIATARDITDRVLLGEKFQENEYMLNLLVKYTNSAVALLDKGLNFIFVSQKWLEETRRKEKDTIGYNLYDVLPYVRKGKKWRPIIKSSLAGNIETGYHDKIFDRYGEPGWYNWIVRPWHDKNNEIAGLYAFIENVTEMMKSHIKLQNSERLLKESQKIAKIGNWEYNPYSDNVEWNNEMYTMFGIDKEDHDGKIDLLFELAHPNDRDRLQKAFQKARKEKSILPLEFKSVTPKGEVKYLYLKGASFLHANGKVEKFYGTVQDITDQKLTEQAILNSERKFRGILEAGPDAVLIINNEGAIDLANRKAEKLFGYPKEEMRNKKLETFLRENYEDETSCLKKYFHVDPQADEGTVELIGINEKGVRFPVEVSINPLETELGLYFNMAIRDITERKNAENTLRNKTEELEIKNKELEQFAFVASHDLQEPLRTISSFVDLIDQDYKGKLDQTADKYIQFILDAAERMRTLIKSLLDYSRIGRSMEFERVDCNDLVQTILDDLSTQVFQANAKIMADKLPVIKGHKYEIKLLLQNLISNAIKFCKPNVSPEIVIRAEKEDKRWKFMVRDNGIGIDEKHQEKIFIIFRRLHNRTTYEGAGIGLAHCKKIVELHGGKIWVVSTPGQGSAFYFTIKV